MSIQPVFPFHHPHILQTALPLGGLGAGCICFNGYGGLQDFSIRNRPDITARTDGWSVFDAAFALLHVKGGATRLVEGPFPEGKIYDQGLQGQGYRKGGYEGLPRFGKCRFESGYPFGRVELSDPAMPLRATVTGWSPFIPLDDVSSGMPCAILEYTLQNPTRRKVEFEFSYHLQHPAVGAETKEEGTRNSMIPGKGIFFHNTEKPCAETYASASLTLIGQQRPKIKTMWLRSGWRDAISAIWRECSEGRFTANDGKAETGLDGRNGGSVLVTGALPPGVEITIPVVITWYFPNSNISTNASVSCESGCSCDSVEPRWKTFYSSQWEDARAVALHVHRHYRRLRERTVAFQRELFGSTLPREILDAVSANLAILKSPTILRQHNGNLWGWEGCFVGAGCCAGSCTHVWNYAQSLPHLFPNVERTLREQELERSMDAAGHINFRSALPDGPPSRNFHAAADGQLGGIMKVWRDWQISGDCAWMQRLYPLAKRSLDYCIATWDPDREGALVQPHHNTYDIEFWGPDGMCGSVYIGALSAMQLMAEALENVDDAQHYGDLACKAARFLEKELFNGEYFYHRVERLDGSFMNAPFGPEMQRILKREGPKYQYGAGCLSDGVIGEWMARIYGIETPLSAAKVRKNLQAIYRHNFRKDLSTHANPQRSGYALGKEAGLLLCTWPRGGKPILPFPYSDEVWTGIEYQVASHLIAEGMVREGLQIVRAARKRYDGKVRNPWNEYECGNYYARAMASYALLGAYSGFRYSKAEKTLWLAPQSKKPFRTFFSTADGYGSIALQSGTLTVSVLEGELTIDRLILNHKELSIKKTARPGKPVVVAL